MGNDSTKVRHIKNVERFCTPSINLRMMQSIIDEFETHHFDAPDKQQKEDKRCLRYCYRLIKNTEGNEVWKNAKLIIDGNFIHVEIKAGDCEKQTVHVSLDHTGKPWHDPPNLEESPPQAEETGILTALKGVTEIRHRNTKANFISTSDDGSTLSEDLLKLCPNKSAKNLSDKGFNKVELSCAGAITMQSISKIQASIRSRGYDFAMQQCLFYANTLIEKYKQEMSRAKINIHCDGKTVMINSSKKQNVFIINIALNQYRKPFHMIESGGKRGLGVAHEMIQTSSSNSKPSTPSSTSGTEEDSGYFEDSFLCSKRMSCGRKDVKFRKITAKKVEELITEEQQTHELRENELECLRCCRDLLENRIEMKHHEPLVNIAVIVLPESKCGGRHWKLYTGAGTNSYTVTWDRKRKRAYYKNTAKTLKQAALETVQLLLPNYLKTRNMKCAKCKININAARGAWLQSSVPKTNKHCKAAVSV